MVQTDHVRVEVVGTRFSVTTDVRCSTVRVTHGVVRASSTSIEGPGHRLRAGMSRRFCRRAEKRHAGLGEGDALVREALSLLGDASSAEKLRHADRLLTSYLKRFARGPLADAEAAVGRLVAVAPGLGDLRQEAGELGR